MSILYLKNEEGIDFYKFLIFLEPSAMLVEVFPGTGDIFGFTGMGGEAIDYTTRFPAERRLLEVRPPRTGLKEMRWDGTDFNPIPPPISPASPRPTSGAA